MNSITTIMPDAANLESVLQLVLVGVLVIFGIGAILRSIFGRGSALTRSVSASLSILMAYLAAIGLYLFVPSPRLRVDQLPFLTVTVEKVLLWDIASLSDSLLYASLVRMGILALLVNLLESLLPQGNKLLTWYLWRCVTVLGALLMYALICGLIDRYAPAVFGEWAVYVLVGFWASILLTGVLKVLLSIVLTVVNPIIGALYAFFFSNIVGKQFSKSILTTILMTLIIRTMNRCGMDQFAFSDFSLAAYGPICVIVVVVLYLFGKLL